MKNERRVRLSRVGRRQVLRMPREFELPGREAILRKEGARLIIEPKTKAKTKESLLGLLATLEPIRERFPEIEDLPAEPVDL
jgi:antitoxin VapB